MIKTIRKGAKVRYMGNSIVAHGKVLTVQHKSGSHVEVFLPILYLDGSVHNSYCSVPISDIELIQEA